MTVRISLVLLDWFSSTVCYL